MASWNFDYKAFWLNCAFNGESADTQNKCRIEEFYGLFPNVKKGERWWHCFLARQDWLKLWILNLGYNNCGLRLLWKSHETKVTKFGKRMSNPLAKSKCSRGRVVGQQEVKSVLLKLSVSQWRGTHQLNASTQQLNASTLTLDANTQQLNASTTWKVISSTLKGIHVGEIGQRLNF